MFCYQCQETAKGSGCSVRGVCGKAGDLSEMMDLLVYTLKGVSMYAQKAREAGINVDKADNYILDGLFSTITNANFDKNSMVTRIKKGLKLRNSLGDSLKAEGKPTEGITHDCACWYSENVNEYETKAKEVGILGTKDEDIRSLRELLIYGLKGIAAYTSHAGALGYKDKNIFEFINRALIATTNDSMGMEDLVSLVLECGKYGVDAMSLLDKANTETYGNPEITKVNIGVRNNPAILISGHDLKDMEELLKQTDGSGIDIYTHSEMLPANYYPKFKKYKHFVGNYGSSWWKQGQEFESFNGPILMTSNCITPVKESYRDRIYTTGSSGYVGVKHIDKNKNGSKDFRQIIEQAKKCAPPEEIEKGEIVGGFAHKTVLGLADKIVEAVKKGAIKKFIVMAGCDGRMKSREYYTEFAKKLPQDTVILTAGCAKYRYNKLGLGDIGGIPRVLDAGQCNDSYSLAVIALKLKEAFGLDDINKLPIVYNIAWYEQKAVIVLLALLYLGVKNIHLGPTLPAFLSPNVVKVLVEKFKIGGVEDVNEDLKTFLS